MKFKIRSVSGDIPKSSKFIIETQSKIHYNEYLIELDSFESLQILSDELRCTIIFISIKYFI